jgi:hypothetical protein
VALRLALSELVLLPLELPHADSSSAAASVRISVVVVERMVDSCLAGLLCLVAIY